MKRKVIKQLFGVFLVIILLVNMCGCGIAGKSSQPVAEKPQSITETGSEETLTVHHFSEMVYNARGEKTITKKTIYHLKKLLVRPNSKNDEN